MSDQVTNAENEGMPGAASEQEAPGLPVETNNDVEQASADTPAMMPGGTNGDTNTSEGSAGSEQAADASSSDAEAATPEGGGNGETMNATTDSTGTAETGDTSVAGGSETMDSETPSETAGAATGDSTGSADDTPSD